MPHGEHKRHHQHHHHHKSDKPHSSRRDREPKHNRYSDQLMGTKIWMGFALSNDNEAMVGLNRAAEIVRERTNYQLKRPHMSIGWCVVSDYLLEQSDLHSSLNSQVKNLIQEMADNFILEFVGYKLVGKGKSQIAAEFCPKTLHSNADATQIHYKINSKVHDIFRYALKSCDVGTTSEDKIHLQQEDTSKPVEKGIIDSVCYYALKVSEPVFHITLGTPPSLSMEDCISLLPKNIPSIQINPEDYYVNHGERMSV